MILMKPMFAEIILPLPLSSTFTYEIPSEMESSLQVGSRVLVQFGRKKFYTGIVESVHSTMPAYEVKPLMALLDPRPAVRYPQMKLWKWISEYYLCSVGEVYKAAVPTGLKPESETSVTLNQDFEADSDTHFTERQAIVIQLLEQKKRMSISEISIATGLANAAGTVSQLLQAGVVEVDERIVEKYRPKKQTFVVLDAERGDNEKLHSFFDRIKRARQQENALVSYLDKSGWMRQAAPLHDVSRTELLEVPGVTPGVLKALVDKGILRMERRVINRFNSVSDNIEISLVQLSAGQRKAMDEIRRLFQDKDVVLLHGLTGSGKTEIYNHLIAAALKDGTQVLYLVPEISLTTQLTDRLRRAFGNRLIVYHSKFTDNERVDIWKRLLTDNEPAVVLGARSSVFLPFARLGLVIVDEEHEASFKQYDPAPRYNARDVATVLASMHGARVLLGSATPSVETFYKASSGKYGLASLYERFEGAELPEVEIVDMKEQRKKKISHGSLSRPLMHEMREAIGEELQGIVFQNRRGFAPMVICRTCGWTPKCDNCDVSLVYHKKINLLKCHYCGFTSLMPRVCPACEGIDIETYGYGTERIAEEVQEIFKESRISRMDLDTTRNKDAFQEIIENFSAHRSDILVGTQMVTKGLDFEKVKVVGVINADTLLIFPDFRSDERAFNMLEQVAGRAGRRNGTRGKVIIQTTRPDDPVLKFVKDHDYQGFYHHEIIERKRYSYPPFTKVIGIYLKNKDSVLADRAATAMTMKLREIFGSRVLGPEKPFVSRVALWYIQSIMLKVEAGASMSKVKRLLRECHVAISGLPEMKATMVYYDVDPV